MTPRKPLPSKLGKLTAQQAAQVDHWCREKTRGGEGLTLADACSRLRSQFGISISPQALSNWLMPRRTEEYTDAAVARMHLVAAGSRRIGAAAQEANANLSPALRQLIELIATQIALQVNSGSEAQPDPNLIRLLVQLTGSANDSQRTVLKEDELRLKAEAQAHEREKFIAAQKSKLEAGLEAVAEAFKSNKVAMEFYQKAREVIATSMG